MSCYNGKAMTKKVLIVDDSKILLEMEKMIFARTGAQVIAATNGKDALRIAAEQKPDIVILDLVLNDVPGDEVCMNIKAHPATDHILVLMVCSRGTPEEIETCRRAGCDDYVLKPIRNQELLSKVSELLRVPHRRSMRILVRLETRGAMGQEVSFFGVSRDISETGMLIETDKVLDVGVTAMLRFFLPGFEEIVVIGKIVRSDVRGTSRAYGVHFQEIAMQQQDLITRFIEMRNR